MRSPLICGMLALAAVVTSGCAIRHYRVDKDRVDQGLSEGNKGYLSGEKPQQLETAQRPATRPTYVTEIELPFLGEKKKAPPVPMALQEEKLPEAAAPAAPFEEEREQQGDVSVSSLVALEQYTVKRGDTLEKIAQRFYGSSRAWRRIADANKEALKSPDRIYEGQVLNIPVEKLKEPAENLK